MAPRIKYFTPQVWEREWGEEILVIHVPGLYTGKILKMKAGTRGGLQFHRKKNEAGYLYSGELLFEYDTGDGVLKKRMLVSGTSIHIPPGAVHRETAITDCIIFEVSNPVFNDRVRVEDRYGEKIEYGLPTTEDKDIRIE
ncbi:MAG: hypothetical protein HYZ69_03280 [Candidatus Colwellbacteria bacterium]|nr:hypothetical protein [Candidatus Colwellbacteria bacterium]